MGKVGLKKLLEKGTQLQSGLIQLLGPTLSVVQQSDFVHNKKK